MTVVIDTPEGINMLRLISMAHALALEVNTGMKMSRGVSVLAIAQRDGITNKRTKKGALKDVVEYIQLVHEAEGRPPWEPSETIVRAMG